MVTWQELVAEAPRIAEVFVRRHAATGNLCLLATFRSDGYPRISPMEPRIFEGQLVIAGMYEETGVDLRGQVFDPFHVADLTGASSLAIEDGRRSPSGSPVRGNGSSGRPDRPGPLPPGSPTALAVTGTCGSRLRAPAARDQRYPAGAIHVGDGRCDVRWFRRRPARSDQGPADAPERSSAEPGDGAESREVAERLTTRRRRHTDKEVAELSDRETVQGWLSTLGSEGDQQVFVHRPWGTVVAVANRRNDPVGVFLSDGDQSWHASPPGAGDRADLTPDQVEQVLLDALASAGPPEWPDWHIM